MLDPLSIKRIHCIGIGGIGVGGIADFLLRRGFQVSGSDLKPNKITEHLVSQGATVMLGHAPENVENVDVVVYSSAVTEDNPEFQAAKSLGVHLLKRAEMLAELMRDSQGIAISGTHGKTTTTSLMTAILIEAGLDPSFMVGGLFNQMDSPAGLGTGEYFIAEADESDASFLSLHPTVAVVTNLDYDHMETYDGNFDTLKQTFSTFLSRLPATGLAVLCADNAPALALAASAPCAVASFGFSETADFHVYDVDQTELVTRFSVRRPDGLMPLHVCLNLPGRHNVLNALAAIVVAHHIGIGDRAVLHALSHFHGVGRRFHVLGGVPIVGGSVHLVDDYGHHPQAIAATLQAAHSAWPDRRVVLAFQPHRYTRTRDLLEDFAAALSQADVLILVPVFAAGEVALPEADSQALGDVIKQAHHSEVSVLSDLNELPAALVACLQSDDLLILQGAGDIGAMAQQVLEQGLVDVVCR